MGTPISLDGIRVSDQEIGESIPNDLSLYLDLWSPTLKTHEISLGKHDIFNILIKSPGLPNQLGSPA